MLLQATFTRWDWRAVLKELRDGLERILTGRLFHRRWGSNDLSPRTDKILGLVRRCWSADQRPPRLQRCNKWWVQISMAVMYHVLSGMSGSRVNDSKFDWLRIKGATVPSAPSAPWLHAWLTALYLFKGSKQTCRSSFANTTNGIPSLSVTVKVVNDINQFGKVSDSAAPPPPPLLARFYFVLFLVQEKCNGKSLFRTAKYLPHLYSCCSVNSIEI